MTELENHLWMLKLMGRSYEKTTADSHGLKESFHKPLNYKGINSNFTMRKPSMYHIY